VNQTTIVEAVSREKHEQGEGSCERKQNSQRKPMPHTKTGAQHAWFSRAHMTNLFTGERLREMTKEGAHMIAIGEAHVLAAHHRCQHEGAHLCAGQQTHHTHQVFHQRLPT
jgi:hypothetical protein